MNFDKATKDEMISVVRERGISHQIDGEQFRVMDLTQLPGAARAYFNQQTGEWTGEAGDGSLPPANEGMGGTEEYLAEVAQSIKEGGDDSSAKRKDSKKAGKK